MLPEKPPSLHRYLDRSVRTLDHLLQLDDDDDLEDSEDDYNNENQPLDWIFTTSYRRRHSQERGEYHRTDSNYQ
ncbi:hypothetical protein C0J52_22285 [Blattella germanica]|nr:hypothetical protein C0J52_22285 [Blattella germanica]